MPSKIVSKDLHNLQYTFTTSSAPLCIKSHSDNWYLFWETIYANVIYYGYAGNRWSRTKETNEDK